MSSRKIGLLAVLLILAVPLYFGGNSLYRHFTKKPLQSANPNQTEVPPPGIAPFDPKPLMEALIEKTKTDKFRFCALGDTKHADTLPGYLKFLDEQINPDFVITTGDLVAKGGGQVGPGFYEMLTGEFGKQMRKRPWWPVIGNHEVAGEPLMGLDALQAVDALKKDQIMQKKNLASGLVNFMKFYNMQSDCYSYTFRNSLFIALPFEFPIGAQVKWLEAELKRAQENKQHVFVYNHMPFFTVGTKSVDDIPNTETDLTALFKKYGVTAVISGHDHGYYHTVRNGVTYIVTAGGGAVIYSCRRASEAIKGDIYYYAVPGAAQDKLGRPTDFVLHRADGSERRTNNMEQFMSVFDVDGEKVHCTCISSNGDKWDEFDLK